MNKLTLIPFVILLFTFCNNPNNKTDKRPNIIVIMSDDMGYSDDHSHLD
ncbi:MAG: hypothetical protein U9N86_02940 [Bacteroidota bacterium]|nr:hypothetical protein [Bacteroidota bacterium]